MNETMQTILKRRSIRSYQSRQIDEQELEEIITAGSFAPTEMGQQPGHFFVLQNPGVLEKLQVSCKEMFARPEIPALRDMASKEEFDVFYKAPTLVIVFADPGAIAPMQDSTLAMENMMLAAASFGIGSCWVHSVMWLFERGGGIEAFRNPGITIPEGYIPYAAAVFGYSAQPRPDAEPRKKGAVSFLR